MKSIAQAHLHPSVSNPELLADLMLQTGMIAIPSERTKGIILVTKEDYEIRNALLSIKEKVKL